MTIEIEYETELPLKVADYENIIRRVVSGAIDFEGCPYEAEVHVLLTDNEAIRQINWEYRKIDSATDVLSFPMVSYEEAGNFDHVEEDMDCFHPETGELLLGDIVISVEKVDEQAEKYGHTRERELAFLTAHSMFHLFGYDHMEEKERLLMEQKQDELLQKLQILR